jgi:hypothetical protein
MVLALRILARVGGIPDQSLVLAVAGALAWGGRINQPGDPPDGAVDAGDNKADSR